MDLVPGVMDLWRMGVAAQFKMQSGFKGAYVLVNRPAKKVISIILWTSEDDMEVSGASGVVQKALDMFAELLAQIPAEERYEVLLEI